MPLDMGKPEWWGYPTVKKNFEDMCNRLDSMPACDRRADGQTDRRTSCDGIVRAMHTRRAVKTILILVDLGGVMANTAVTCC